MLYLYYSLSRNGLRQLNSKWINPIPKVALKRLLLMSCLYFSANSIASLVNEITIDEKKLVVNELANKLIAEYVNPDSAVLTAKYLESNMSNDQYLGYDEITLFAEKLTKDIQSITNDQHIRVRLRPAEFTVMANDNNNDDFKEVEILAGNVGLLKFDSFSPNPKVKTKVDTIFSRLSDVDSLIIDLRSNKGGSPDLVLYISSYFFTEKTHLNSIYWRDKNSQDDYWTLDDIGGTKRPDLPIFILTSQKTFSAAEEFAYNLQVLKRAIIVGETTKGGANPGRSFDLPLKLSIFIPTGKAINPITLSNWEGVGVTPDFPVLAVKAFEEAYAMAKYAAIKYRITHNKSTPEEKYSVKDHKKKYGLWLLAKHGCPIKYRWAQPEYNEKNSKYQFPYQVKYYGNGNANVEYQLGNSSGRMNHTQHFNSREDVKSGISMGFSTFDNLSMLKCKILN